MATTRVPYQRPGIVSREPLSGLLADTFTTSGTDIGDGTITT